MQTYSAIKIYLCKELAGKLDLETHNTVAQVSAHLEDLVGAPHVHGGDVIAPDLDKLHVAPPLVYPVHDPLRDAGLPHLEPLPQPDPDTLQPPQLVPRKRQLRRGRRRRDRGIPPASPPAPRCVGLAIARGPARV